MPDQETRGESEPLQFDRVVTKAASSGPPGKVAVSCAGCQTSIETEYFDVNGNIVCGRCRATVESAADTPRGVVPLVTAGVYGLGAGVVGAAIYYAVMAIAHLEIGIVAILIGYMVGYGVRKGAGGRGGRRFQVLAVALTYASVALAYAPIAVKQAIDADPAAQKAAAVETGGNTHAAAATDSGGAAAGQPGVWRVLLSLAFLSALIAALPVLVVLGSFPSGLISGFIIFIGMQQAWRMTGAACLQIRGPYRVGVAPASTSA